MRIIVLSGDGNCGKTSTINIVYQMMIQEDYMQVAGHFKSLGEDPADFRDILIKGCKKVGIASMGDRIGKNDPDKISDLLSYFEKENCYIAIIPCTSGNAEGAKAIKSRANQFQYIYKLKASLPSLFRVENVLMANRIFKEI